MQQHSGVHLGADVLQRVSQPLDQPVRGSFVVVAQEAEQRAQGAAFVRLIDRNQWQPFKGIDVHLGVFRHAGVKHDVFHVHGATIRAVQPHGVRITQGHAHGALGDSTATLDVP